MSGRFPWGKVQQDHEIGPYLVREYVTPQGETLFHGYIEGADQHESWFSLDDALAGLIVHRALGPNNSAINYHFMAGIRAMVDA